MKNIGLISDTHGYFGDDVSKHLENCDEIWHAGDIGNVSTVIKYEKIAKHFRAVYGNIDGADIRTSYGSHLYFEIEGVNVLMMHIGGYPGRYTKEAKNLLDKLDVDLFISGHSHITKIMRDKKRNLIHMNPGSCGIYGIHVFRTLLRFNLDSGKVYDVELIELGRRALPN